MSKYVAFLRGVGPMIGKMSDLKRCFESAGFENVKTVLASGNVVFESQLKSARQIERIAEAAMQKQLGRTFYTIVRSARSLEKMLQAEPHANFKLAGNPKRIVTFLRATQKPATPLPIEQDGARILATTGREVFTVYLPSPRGPVFMSLIEKTFGSNVTTRTWETVKKCVKVS